MPSEDSDARTLRGCYLTIRQESNPVLAAVFAPFLYLLIRVVLWMNIPATQIPDGCPNCGFALVMTDDHDVCPFCGWGPGREPVKTMKEAHHDFLQGVLRND